VTIASEQPAIDALARPRGSELWASAGWTVAGFVLYILGGVASILVIGLLENLFLQPFGLRPEAGTFALSLQNGIHDVAWGVLVAAIAAPLGRRIVAGIQFRWPGTTMLVGGLVIAAAATTLGDEFVRARFDVYEPRAMGLTLFTGPAIVAVALATWAALAVPASGAIVPALAALAAAACLALSLLPSVPGLDDGIDATSIPLVIAFTVGIAYATLAVVLVARHAVAALVDQRRR
jgi:hypothetical protein